MNHFDTRSNNAVKYIGNITRLLMDTIPGTLWLDADGFPVTYSSNQSIIFPGDNTFGEVKYSFTAEGHLVLVVHNDNHGTLLYSPTCNGAELTNDLPAEFRSQIPPSSVAHMDKVYVNPLGEFAIGIMYNRLPELTDVRV